MRGTVTACLARTSQVGHWHEGCSNTVVHLRGGRTAVLGGEPHLGPPGARQAPPACLDLHPPRPYHAVSVAEADPGGLPTAQVQVAREGRLLAHDHQHDATGVRSGLQTPSGATANSDRTAQYDDVEPVDHRRHRLAPPLIALSLIALSLIAGSLAGRRRWVDDQHETFEGDIALGHRTGAEAGEAGEPYPRPGQRRPRGDRERE